MIWVHSTVALLSTQNKGFMENETKLSLIINFMALYQGVLLRMVLVVNFSQIFKIIIVIPPANYVCGRVYCFHVVRLSVRPNERKCVRDILFP